LLPFNRRKSYHDSDDDDDNPIYTHGNYNTNRTNYTYYISTRAMSETQALRARPLAHLRSSSYNLLPQAPTSMAGSRIQSPAARSSAATDDLIGLLSPATVLAALRAPPPGPLKACLSTAALSEQEFALRAATASARVLEWLDEIKGWSWPSGSGSAGFEQPTWGRGRLWGKGGLDAARNQSPEGDVYWGSLRSSEVARLEKRVDEICAEMEELGLEEIKDQVLHNHILPMSRPATPLSASLLNYNKMDDLTAVVTAIIVQALPNIARLSRLLRVWAIRIAVLHGIPALLDAIADAEIALRAGWNAISMASNDNTSVGIKVISATPPSSEDDEVKNGASGLSKKSFDVMRKILEAKVAKPGSHLDRMLDSLEGLEDTLPEAWLDRMEAVEREFGELVAASGRIIREAEWAKTAKKVPRLAPSPQFPPTVSNTLSIDGSDSSDENSDVPKLLIPSNDEDGGVLLPPIHMGLRRASDESTTIAMHENYDLSSEPRQSPGSPPRLPRLRGGRGSFNDAQLASPLRLGIGSVASPRLAPSFAEDAFMPVTPLDSSFEQIDEENEDQTSMSSPDDNQGAPVKGQKRDPADDYLRQKIRRILTSMPSNQFSLSMAPEPASASTLNPPDLALPRVRKAGSREPLRGKRSTSSLSSSRAQTPSYTLTPAPYAKGASQRRPNRGQQETRVYHLTRSNGGPPIKLFIRTVGENGERVMVRVGGGWADLGEYLKEYAAHHGRRSTSTAADRVEIRDLPTDRSHTGSSPPRPSSSMDSHSPMTPLVVRKKRRGSHLDHLASPPSLPGSPPVDTPLSKPFSPVSSNSGSSVPRTPGNPMQSDVSGSATTNSASTRSTNEHYITPSSRATTRSRASSRSWADDDSSTGASLAPPVPPIPSIALGLAGPKGKEFEISDESRAWIESVQQKVRMASGERRAVSGSGAALGGGSNHSQGQGRPDDFGDMGKVGGTKRLFRKNFLDDGRKP
jgi:hypothetical protein